jgi:hypothetical protein
LVSDRRHKKVSIKDLVRVDESQKESLRSRQSKMARLYFAMPQAMHVGDNNDTDQCYMELLWQAQHNFQVAQGPN